MQEQIKQKEIISYGLGDFACGMIYNFVFTFVFYYYSDVIKLSLGAVAVIMTAGRGFITVIDFFVGMLIDKTNTRHGSIRPYILWFFIPVGAASVLLFTTVQGSAITKTIYAVVTYMCYSALYALLNDPYTLLMSAITGQEKERLKLNTAKTILSGVGGVLVMAFTLKSAEYVDGLMGVQLLFGIIEISGFTIVALIYALTGMLFLWICFRNTKERTTGTRMSLSLKESFQAAKKNKFWKMGIVIGCFINLAMTIKMTSTLYYAQYVMGNKGLSNIVLMLHMATSIAAVLCLPVLIKKVGRRHTFLTGGVLVILGSLLQWVAGSSMIAFLMGSMMVSFSLNILNSLSVFVMFDTIDYTQKTVLVRPQGFMFSVYCVSCKISTAIAAAILSFGLGQSGYVAGEIQNHRTIQSIECFYLFSPILLAACVLFVAYFFEMERQLRFQMEEVA